MDTCVTIEHTEHTDLYDELSGMHAAIRDVRTLLRRYEFRQGELWARLRVLEANAHEHEEEDEQG